MDKNYFRMIKLLLASFFCMLVVGCSCNKNIEPSTVDESNNVQEEVGLNFDMCGVRALEYTIPSNKDFELKLEDLYLDGNRIYGKIKVLLNNNTVVTSAELDLQVRYRETKCNSRVFVNNPVIEDNAVKWDFSVCLQNNEMEYDNIEFIFSKLVVNDATVLGSNNIYDVSASGCNITSYYEYELNGIYGKITPMGMQARVTKQEQEDIQLYYDGHLTNVDTKVYLCEYNQEYAYYYFDWAKYIDISHIDKIIFGEQIIYDSANARKRNPTNKMKCVIGISPSDFPDAYTVNRINQYLESQGCNYYVIFKIITPGGLEGYLNYSAEEIVNYVDEYITDGNQLDMYFTDYGNDPAVNSCYEIMAQKGLLYSLNSFIAERNISRYIPDALIANSMIDGRIYGINTSLESISTMPAYIINNRLLEKYGYSVSDVNCRLSELKELLKVIARGEAENTRFNCVNFLNYNNTIMNYQYLDRQIGSIVMNSSGKAEGILDCNDYITFLKELHECNCVYNKTGKVADTFITVVDSLNPFDDFLQFGVFSDSNSYTAEDFKVIYPYGEGYIFNSYFLNLCIMNTDSDKANAMDFLSRIYSDVNLYEIISQYRFANKLLCRESEKEKYIHSMMAEGAGVTDIYVPNDSLNSSIVEATNKAIEKLWNVFNVDDFTEYINHIRSELENVGIEELIEEINREIQ